MLAAGSLRASSGILAASRCSFRSALSFSSSDALKMAWQEEKARLAQLISEEWMERADTKKATTLNDVPTWRDYSRVKMKGQGHGKESPAEFTPLPEGVELYDKVSIFAGDITKLAVDAVVNAANKRLLGGGGVDGAIHRAAGPNLLEECRTLNGCDTGDAKLTSGYDLPARAVIHTVGPMGVNPQALSNCYEKSLSLLVENNLKSIAFPCISTGVYGYPSTEACPVALKSVREFLVKHHSKVDRVVFCLFLDKDIEVYEEQMQLYFPVPKNA